MGDFPVYRLAWQLLGSFLWQCVLGVVRHFLCQDALDGHCQLRQAASAVSNRIP